MPIDDKPEMDTARSIAKEAQKSVQEMITRSQFAGLASLLLPLCLGPVGSAVLAAINEGRQQLFSKHINERLEDIGTVMAGRLEEMGDSKVDKGWFCSEEFQTILFEAARQVIVTTDRKKLAMLGNALANSGSTDFRSEENKELFLQFVRELAPQHIAMLSKLSPSGQDEDLIAASRWQPSMHGKGDELLVLQMLMANGLVTESTEPPKVRSPRFGSGIPSTGQTARAFGKLAEDLQRTPRRTFRLSSLGRDFLKLVSLSRIPE